jgi:hypothetical protein
MIRRTAPAAFVSPASAAGMRPARTRLRRSASSAASTLLLGDGCADVVMICDTRCCDMPCLLRFVLECGRGGEHARSRRRGHTAWGLRLWASAPPSLATTSVLAWACPAVRCRSAGQYGHCVLGAAGRSRSVWCWQSQREPGPPVEVQCSDRGSRWSAACAQRVQIMESPRRQAGRPTVRSRPHAPRR